jgi:hypothetical protein
MPLGCAKRGKLFSLSDLPESPRGLSTAFQQLLWKAKLAVVSTNRVRHAPFIEDLLSRDPSAGKRI